MQQKVFIAMPSCRVHVGASGVRNLLSIVTEKRDEMDTLRLLDARCKRALRRLLYSMLHNALKLRAHRTVVRLPVQHPQTGGFHEKLCLVCYFVIFGWKILQSTTSPRGA